MHVYLYDLIHAVEIQYFEHQYLKYYKVVKINSKVLPASSWSSLL
jgi:hypothetical protein